MTSSTSWHEAATALLFPCYNNCTLIDSSPDIHDLSKLRLDTLYIHSPRLTTPQIVIPLNDGAMHTLSRLAVTDVAVELAFYI